MIAHYVRKKVPVVVMMVAQMANTIVVLTTVVAYPVHGNVMYTGVIATTV